MANSVSAFEILLIEDQPADARLAVDALRSGPEDHHVHIVRDAREASAFLHREPPFSAAPAPDVIVLALNAPPGDGHGAFAEIRQSDVPPPVVIVSAIPSEPVGRLFRAGAADYLVKGHLEHLGTAVTAAVSSRAPLRKLSPRQIEVLRLIAEGNATRDIAHQLRVSGKTVEAHRAELMRRLGIRTVAGLVRYALRACLVELGPE